jgi:hypothetical protein
MRIRVECYAGYRGAETPRRLVVAGRTLAVLEVVDRWIGPDHRYFEVRVTGGAVFIIREDEGSGTWDLATYDAPPA